MLIFFKVKTNIRKCILISKHKCKQHLVFLYFHVLPHQPNFHHLILLLMSTYQMLECSKHLSCNLHFPFLQLRFCLCNIWKKNFKCIQMSHLRNFKLKTKIGQIQSCFYDLCLITHVQWPNFTLPSMMSNEKLGGVWYLYLLLSNMETANNFRITCNINNSV